MNKKQKNSLIRIIISFVFLLAGFAASHFALPEFICFAVFSVSLVTVGYDVIYDAFNNIFHGHMLDENFLMFIGATGAYILGNYSEGTFIMLLYQVGELFQSIAVGKSRNSVKELMNIRPDYVNIEKNGEIIKEDPYSVCENTEIIILPGEKVPIDCVVISGNSFVDTSALTGESVPVHIKSGDKVISGITNLSSKLTAMTVGTFETSTAAKILELVENATSKKSKSENFVKKFAKYYTPIVVLLAFMMFIICGIVTGNFSTWLYRSISFLVISCPCAIVVSVPLAFFGAIGGASKAGILIKGSNYMETLSECDTAVFDKTGTITEGQFKITEINTESTSKEELLRLAALCEQTSPHPIAKSILKEIPSSASLSGAKNHRVVIGKGMACEYKSKKLLVGNSALMEENQIDYKKNDSVGTAVYVAFDGKFIGSLLISDEIKPTSKDSVTALKKLGIKSSVMLTGDRKEIAENVAKSTGIDRAYSELLPNQKVEHLERIISDNDKKVFYVGDGINDAPCLARADVGIAMGSIGSDAAIEAADIVIMNDDPALIATAISISKKTVRISKENIYFAIAVKLSQLILSALGLSGIYMAVFADVGVLILAILNSMRTLKTK